MSRTASFINSLAPSDKPTIRVFGHQLIKKKGEEPRPGAVKCLDFEFSLSVDHNIYRFSLKPDVTNRTLERKRFLTSPGCLIIHDSQQFVITEVSYPNRAPYLVTLCARKVA